MKSILPTLMMMNKFVIFKGGTAFNTLLNQFQKLFPQSSYVLPVTDDGGSSREIRRVFGGPSIGDLRSTLNRLADDQTPERRAIKQILEHRLSKKNPIEAMEEWVEFLNLRHPSYRPISKPSLEIMHRCLSTFEKERLSKFSLQFNMMNASVGNLLFTGARILLGSLKASIELYANLTHISQGAKVLPIIDSNDRLSIGVKLKNKEILIGQHQISHPSQSGNVKKKEQIPLPSPIEELFYLKPLNPETAVQGDKANPDFENECFSPQPNPEVIAAIKQADAILYGIGSLWTSIIPSLILEGMGEVIADRSIPKIFMLNNCQDRETFGLDASDFIQALTHSLNRYGALNHPVSKYVTHLFIGEETSIPINFNESSTF